MLVSNIKLLVAASGVLGNCRSDVFTSVSCGPRENMEGFIQRVVISAQCCVPTNYLTYQNSLLLGGQKCLKTMFGTLLLHPETCAYFLYLR